jgi:glutamate-ammonia-ligase adenylyltransferase
MNLYEVKENIIEYLNGLGYRDTDKAYYIIREILDKAPDIPDTVQALIEACANSYSPDDCLLNMSSYLDKTLSPYSFMRELVSNDPLLKVMTRVFSVSRYLSSILIREPSIVYWLFEGGFLYDYTQKELMEELNRMSDLYKHDELFIDALNSFKSRHTLLIALRELFGRDEIQITVQKLSRLYDMILDTVYHWNKREYPECDMTILSLGKLGSEEVNFSSDLDLIFICAERTERIQEFGRKIIDDLSRNSRNGYLFRIDMRLRPEGESSPLVVSHDYMKEYIANRARTWERQAYIRARFSAGDKAIGDAVMATVDKFVYRSTMTIGDIQSIIFIKNEIDGSVRDNPLGHVKKGRGGIRDIEFIVQAYQLLYGKSMPRLKRSNIFLTLETLYHANILNMDVYETLRKSYVLLRRIEHYLQLYENLQVFELPDDPQKLVLLAQLLGYRTAGEFRFFYTEMRDEVRNIFTDTFSRVFGHGEIAPVSEIILNPEIEENYALGLIADYRFEDPRSVLNYFKYLANLSPRIRTALSLALNNILQGVKDHPFPDKKVFNLFSVIQSYGAVSTFLNLIRFDPQFRLILLDAVAESDYLTGILGEFPGILDLFIDPEALETTEELPVAYGWMMETYSGDVKRALYHLKAAVFFRTVIREFGRALNSAETGEILTGAAEFIIGKAYSHLGGEKARNQSVIGVGRLGSREIAVGSDADVFFVYHDAPGNSEIYTDFVPELMTFLEKIIPMDARLRPYGRNSAITIDEAGFFEYMRTKGEFWEKAAYVKARPVVCPDGGARERLAAGMREFVLSGNKKGDKSEIKSLRGKIHNAYHKPGMFNLKKDPGGLLDIDFAVFMELRKRDFRQFVNSTADNLKLLGLDEVYNIYCFYRDMENILRMNGTGEGSVIDFSDTRMCGKIAARLGFGGIEEWKKQFDERINVILSLVQ